VIPKNIPKWLRCLMITARPATDEDDTDAMLLRDFQIEAFKQKVFRSDKVKAVKKIALRIRNKEDFIRQAKGKAKKMLKEQLAELEREQFLLLRDEILNACKNQYGMIDYKKLERVKGYKK